MYFLFEPCIPIIVYIIQKIYVSSSQPSSQPNSTPITMVPGTGFPGQPYPPQAGTLYPVTTRSPSASRSGVDLSGVNFVESLEVITCGPAGGVFHSKSNNVTITFPEGAIPSDAPSVSIEFGVALLGPFGMPSSEVKPVSPFIWICVDAVNFTFSQPITVIIPHFISCYTEHDCEALTFMKADHRDLDDEGKFPFRKCEGKSKFRPRNMKGTLITKHSCFLCICSQVPDITISNANYCLMMVMPNRQEARFEVTFCITYLLETCMEVNKLTCTNSIIFIKLFIPNDCLYVLYI